MHYQGCLWPLLCLDWHARRHCVQHSPRVIRECVLTPLARCVAAQCTCLTQSAAEAPFTGPASIAIALLLAATAVYALAVFQGVA